MGPKESEVKEVKPRRAKAEFGAKMRPRRPPGVPPKKGVKTKWHKTLVRDWLDHFDTDLEEETESVDLEMGVTFDQKLVYLTCHILALVGPTVQITVFAAMVLFFLSESMVYTHCKVRNRPVFLEIIPWSSCILKHGGVSDVILAWHYVLLYILQMTLGILVLCDQYVYLVHRVTGERFEEDGHCYAYSAKQIKLFVFVPIWLIIGVLLTGSQRQQRIEMEVISVIARWCMRLELLGLLSLGAGVWTGQHSFEGLLNAYVNFKFLPVILAIPLATIILHQYWINIPKTFGRTGERRGCSTYSIKGIYSMRLIFICVFLGLIQPFYIPFRMFQKMKQECSPFWLALQYSLSTTFFYIVRCSHIIVSSLIGMHFACRGLREMAESGLTIRIFIVKNPINNSPIVALFTVGILAGVTACVMTLNDLLYLQGLNIVFSRAVLSLSILLRERHARPVEKIIRSSYDEREDDFIVSKKDLKRLKIENLIAMIFFLLGVIAMLILSVVSEWAIPLMIESDLIALAVMLSLGFMAFLPLTYIATLLCFKKVTVLYSPTNWQMFVCVAMYMCSVVLCVCSYTYGGLAFIGLLAIGIFFYLLELYLEYRKAKKLKRLLEGNRIVEEELKRYKKKAEATKKKKETPTKERVKAKRKPVNV